MKKKWLVTSFSLVLLLLAGCVSEPYVVEKGMGDTSEQTEKVVPTEKMLTLKVESSIKIPSAVYRFSGFMNEDTIVFNQDGPYGYDSQVYHMAEPGYKFSFSDAPEWSLEVIQANRKEGFIELKVTKKQQP